MHLVGRTLAVAVGLVLGGVLIETITSSAATGPATIRIWPADLHLAHLRRASGRGGPERR